jgi:hypothetical protein
MQSQIKGRWGRLTDEIKWKWQKELKQFAIFFFKRARSNFAICRAPARFLVLKGPFAAKECGPSRLVNYHCLTAPHKTQRLTDVALQHPWVKNAIWTTFFTKAKGTLPPEKGHFLCLLKTWGGALAPRSYASETLPRLTHAITKPNSARGANTMEFPIV